MNTTDFIRKARDLSNTLERFSITRSRLCAVTLYSGDGICVAFDRSDRSAAPLHRFMKNAFPSDSVILSYEPLAPQYKMLSPVSDGILREPMLLADAADSFKAYLYRQSEEKYVSAATDKDYHVVYTVYGVCVSAQNIKKLENSVFRTEEYIQRLDTLSSIRNSALNDAGERARAMADKYRAMEKGKLYLTERKNSPNGGKEK